MRTSSARTVAIGIGALALFALVPARPLAAQSLEGSKWSIEEEGVDTAVVWWLGSEGRVRSGDIGIILAGFKWRQAGDSVFITIGDSVKYAALLMSNRLVGGIRSARSRPEGWWSGTRADAAPAAVAAAPVTPTAPASTPTAAQPMSRPADSAATPPTQVPAPSPAPGGRRPLRRILRGDAAGQPANQGAAPADGHEIRRIERAEAAQAAAAPMTGGAPDPAMVGSWTRADSVGIVDGFDLKADGAAEVHLRGGREGTGQWTSDPNESRVVFHGPEGAGQLTLVIWTGGPGLRGALVTVNGRGRTLAFTRGGEGPVRQPAIRQP